MSSGEDEMEVKYQVFVTKSALRQGRKLSISPGSRLEIVNEMKGLRYWPQNRDNYSYEKVAGAFEFKFEYVDGTHWVRIFVFFDDDRRYAWIVKVLAKKTNALTKADLISIETAVSQIEHEIARWKKEQAKLKSKQSLNLVKGGADE